VDNVRGYTLYGDYARPDPPARLLEALAQGDIDVAVAWGPLAGYFAQRQKVPLEMAPVSPQHEAGLPLVFDIALGVRRGDTALRDRLQAALDARRAEVDRILADYGVPRLDLTDNGNDATEAQRHRDRTGGMS
jgi:mxaJ protein